MNNLQTDGVDASMGFVRYKINRTAGLSIGTEIKNTAAIYFDYNAAVITNTTISTIGEPTSVFNIDNSEMKVATLPNPFSGYLTLKYTLAETTNVMICLQ